MDLQCSYVAGSRAVVHAKKSLQITVICCVVSKVCMHDFGGLVGLLFIKATVHDRVWVSDVQPWSDIAPYPGHCVRLILYYSGWVGTYTCCSHHQSQPIRIGVCTYAHPCAVC